MLIQTILFLVFTLVLFFLARKDRTSKCTSLFLVGWFFKCAIGLLFLWIYSFHYGNGKLTEDAGAYKNESYVLSRIYTTAPQDYFSILLSKENSEELIAHYFANTNHSRFSAQSTGINNTRIHIKCLSVCNLLLFNNFEAVFLLYVFLSYLGFLFLWKALRNRVKINTWQLMALLLLTPSLTLWTSSNLKEVPLIFGLCLVLGTLLKSEKWKIRDFCFFLLGLVFIVLFKSYVALLFGLGFFLSWLFLIAFSKRKWAYLIAFVPILVVSINWSLPQKFLKTLSDKQFDFVNVARGGIYAQDDTSIYYISTSQTTNIQIIDSLVEIKKPIFALANSFGKIRDEKKVTLFPSDKKLKFIHWQIGGESSFHIKAINNSWNNFFLTLPEALINSFLRPFPWSKGSVLINSFFFLESLFFITLLTIALRNRKLVRHQNSLLFISILVTVFFLALLIGITTPVVGAIVRYRIPMFLLITIAYLFTNFKHETER